MSEVEVKKVTESSFCCFTGFGGFYNSFWQARITKLLQVLITSPWWGLQFPERNALLPWLRFLSRPGGVVYRTTPSSRVLRTCQQGLGRKSLFSIRVFSFSGVARTAELNLGTRLRRKLADGRLTRRSRPSGFRLYDHRRPSPVSRGGRVEGACVSSARGCRGTMAAPRGEAGGRPNGGSCGGRWRGSVSCCPRSRGSGARLRRRASGVCLEPLPGVSPRRRLSGQRRAANLLLRLPSQRLTPRGAVRRPESALASTSLQWVGTEFGQARAAPHPERSGGWSLITLPEAGLCSVAAGVVAAAVSSSRAEPKQRLVRVTDTGNIIGALEQRWNRNEMEKAVVKSSFPGKCCVVRRNTWYLGWRLRSTAFPSGMAHYSNNVWWLIAISWEWLWLTPKHFVLLSGMCELGPELNFWTSEQ